MLIDPHVHLRDWNQSEKETLNHGLAVAAGLGIDAVFEMPNTDPALTGADTIRRRIAAADAARATCARPIFHGLYGGITVDPVQVRAVAALHRELFPRVVGLKMFAGHSTGRMGVVTTSEQLVVWRTLVAANYRGVMAVHAEREDLLEPDRYDPEHPGTHDDARPALAEIASVQTQIALAEAAGFRGTLHIVHVSSPDTARLIARERDGLPFRLTAGVTPHHLLLSRDAGYRVNPPLRRESERVDLQRHLVEGSLDWIESDHAPHTQREMDQGAAGLPGLPGFRLAVEMLRRGSIHNPVDTHVQGMALPQLGRESGVSTVKSPAGKGLRENINRLVNTACERILEAFGIDPEDLPRGTSNPTLTQELYRRSAREYPLDPYADYAASELV